jgi:nicotinate-nucleotide adenylyltransferase
MSACVGLFGGTFDPVHNGHLSIARSFLGSNLIDELWVLLTPYPPHKSTKDHTDYSTRLNMLKAAFEGWSDLSILTIENELPKPSYSVRTIRHLKKEHPDTTFYFCMGEDSLVKFHSWKKYDEILDEVDLLVARRPEEDHQQVAKEILSAVHFVDHVPLDVASTQIRNDIRSGKKGNLQIPENVQTIIEKENLYR